MMIFMSQIKLAIGIILTTLLLIIIINAVFQDAKNSINDTNQSDIQKKSWDIMELIIPSDADFLQVVLNIFIWIIGASGTTYSLTH